MTPYAATGRVAALFPKRDSVAICRIAVIMNKMAVIVGRYIVFFLPLPHDFVGQWYEFLKSLSV
jgi:hypothetical protein